MVLTSNISVSILEREHNLAHSFSGFMVYKGNFIYNGIQIQNGDPRFELLANRGIFEVIHMPSAPMEIRQDQLTLAKGKE